MAKSKSPKNKKSQARSAKSLAVSFFVGVITVALIALAIFGISQSKNYKTVLGTHTQTNVPSTK